MRKIVLVLGILLVIAMVLPAAAAPAIAKTTGGGYWICWDDQKCGSSWTAQATLANYPYAAKGQAQAQHRSFAGTLHAQIDQLGITEDNIAFVSGIVTNAPDAPLWLDKRICFVAIDGGKGGDDYVTDWWVGDINKCYDDYSLDYLTFHLIEGGNGIINFNYP